MAAAIQKGEAMIKLVALSILAGALLLWLALYTARTIAETRTRYIHAIEQEIDR